jgi:hypothetical protein
MCQICAINSCYRHKCVCHGRTGRKKLGGRKEICLTFSDCARVVKKNFPEKLSKIVVNGGGKNDYEKFLLDSIFPTKLTEFPTKLTEYVPFIFIISQYCPTVKRILPDWFCLPNKLGGGGKSLWKLKFEAILGKFIFGCGSTN